MNNNLAYICSPYRGNLLKRFRNIQYAKHLTKTAIKLGYAPVTPHLYLTKALNDKIPKERQQGLKAGLEILNSCSTIIIGTRFGISAGMTAEIKAAQKHNTIIII